MRIEREGKDQDDGFQQSPPALDSLRELAGEVMEQDDPRDTSRNLLISGGAMAAGAVVLGYIGWWGWQGYRAAVHDEAVAPHHDKAGSPTFMFFAVGAGLLFGAVVLAIFALISFAKVAMKQVRGV